MGRTTGPDPQREGISLQFCMRIKSMHRHWAVRGDASRGKPMRYLILFGKSIFFSFLIFL